MFHPPYLNRSRSRRCRASTGLAERSVVLSFLCPAWACTSARLAPVESASVISVRRVSCGENASHTAQLLCSLRRVGSAWASFDSTISANTVVHFCQDVRPLRAAAHLRWDSSDFGLG